MASKAAKKSSKKTVAKARVSAKSSKSAKKSPKPAGKVAKLAKAAKPAARKAAPAKPQAVPTGYTTVTPFLAINGASDAIEFYKKAFGAVERLRMPGPDGKVMHAEIKIGDSVVMLGDAIMTPATQSGIHLYVKDCDALFAQAIAAGAKEALPLADMFWGDRFGKVSDPFGNTWSIATHKEDVSPEEMQKRMEAMPPPGAPPAAA